MTKSNQTISSEFKWDSEKLLNKIIEDWTPSFNARKEFKEKLDNKIQEKIRLTKEQRADQAAMDAVPRKLKWRFYLTWYWYAVVSFVALFLIWFCTNIFTWTLKVPTKYNYLVEDKAFWDIEKWQIAYNYNDEISNNYDVDIDDIYYDEDIETEESASYSTKSLNSVSKMAGIQSLWATMSATENFIKASDEDYDDIFNSTLNRNFTYNQTYRFAYKDKLFPKLSSEYPILKSKWILIWSNTPNQVLKNLKIWDVSFKNFQDLEIAWLSINQNTENWYFIAFDSNSQTLNFYPNDSREAQEYTGEVPSKKQIIKAVEKDLKQLWVSIKNYWDWEINIEDYDDGMWIVGIFYPFKIQWRDVRNVDLEDRIWMSVGYDLNLQKVVSVVWIDIAAYDISNYPTLDREYIKDEIEKWWSYYNQWALHEDSTVVLFDNMEVVYIPRYDNETTYYVPAIKWEVDTALESYRWPKYVFQEIAQ